MFSRIANQHETLRADPLLVAHVPNADGIARPKFSRRPSSFAMEVNDENQSAAIASLPSIAATKASLIIEPKMPWQDDMRFGIALVFLLLAINAILSMLMPLLPVLPIDHGSTQSIAGITPITQSASGDFSVTSPVTFYTHPESYKPTEDGQSEHSASTNPSISVDDFPVPIAKPLDSEKLLSGNAAGYIVDAQ